MKKKERIKKRKQADAKIIKWDEKRQEDMLESAQARKEQRENNNIKRDIMAMFDDFQRRTKSAVKSKDITTVEDLAIELHSFIKKVEAMCEGHPGLDSWREATVMMLKDARTRVLQGRLNRNDEDKDLPSGNGQKRIGHAGPATGDDGPAKTRRF